MKGFNLYGNLRRTIAKGRDSFGQPRPRETLHIDVKAEQISRKPCHVSLVFRYNVSLANPIPPKPIFSCLLTLL